MRAGRRWGMASGWLHWAAPTVLLLYCSLRSQAAGQGTLLELLNTEGNLTLMASAVNASGLSSLFGDTTERITVFAPTDASFTSALQFGSLQCTTDYYSTGPCTSVSQLLAATDLASIVRNFVVNGVFPTSSLVNGSQLELIGTSVEQVNVLINGQTWIGNAPIVDANLQATNGILHVLGGLPSADLSLNESAITLASKLGNFGPFSHTDRTQLLSPDSSSLPTNIPSLIASYQQVRTIVDLPQAGLVNPMAITYSATAMYRLLTATPAGGYVDSESLSGAPPAAAPAGISVAASPSGGSSSDAPSASSKADGSLSVSSVGGSGPGVVGTASLSGTVQLPGMGEAGVLSGNSCSTNASSWKYEVPVGVKRPSDNVTLAFMTVLQLASLIKSKQVSSVELVEIYTARLQQYDYVLEAVVTYTTDLGMQQAQAADELLAKGTYLGPLHGIPFGLKDIIAVNGYRTTWGAPEFKNQMINEDANVYQRLRAAGAVLIAKVATGEMAYDDIWWGGFVKNPWNIAEGSSGSSAGPTASVVAATLPFSIGTETEGSLMSPAATCGSSSMRPSLGSVGRSYVMMLADSLDKLGPVCRSVEDCAVIFDIIRGRDDLDPTSTDAALIDPFEVDLTKLTVGYLAGVNTGAPEVVEVLSSKGVTLKPFSISYAVNAEDVIMNIMISEAAAHFDYWQRSGQDAQNVRQDYWPPLLRMARLIPAVEYIQAQRARSTLAVQVLASMQAAGIDAFIANSTTELAMCNLVGIPTVSVPIGFSPIPGSANSTRRNPLTLGFFGWPNGEPEILALGMAWQNETSYHLEQPPIDNVEPWVLEQCLPYSRCSLSPASLSPASAPDITIATVANGSTLADSG